MGIFLGRDAFGGDDRPETAADTAPLAGQARFNGAVLFFNWSRCDVEAVLPAEVTLAANSLAPALHPVVFIAVGPLRRAEFEPAGDWLPGAHCPLEHFEAMRAVFALPVIGRRGDGRYVGSRFDWRFEDALVRRIGAQVWIEASLGQGLTPRRC